MPAGAMAHTRVRNSAVPEELHRQSAFFADTFMPGILLDAMPGMVLILNRHRQIVFANRTFTQISG
jgi:PAS domain-containing protein